MICWLVGGAMLVALGGPAWSSEAAARRALAERYKIEAFSRLAREDYSGGIAALKRANRAIRHPDFLLNIAVAYQRWGGHCLEAVAHFRLYFDACPHCSSRKVALARYREARKACQTPLSITVSPLKARIYIDDRRVGAPPTTVPVDPGQHRIRVEAADHVPFERTLTLEAGQPRTLSVQLRPSPPAPITIVARPAAHVVVLGREGQEAAGPSPLQVRLSEGDYEVRLVREGFAPLSYPLRARAGEAQVVELDLIALSTPGEISADWRLVTGWSAVGLGIVALGVGGWMHAETFGRAEDAQGLGPSPIDLERRRSLQEDFDAASLRMTAGYSTGAFLIGAGASFLAWHWMNAPHPGTPGARREPGPLTGEGAR